jgi:hypothetical protein
MKRSLPLKLSPLLFFGLLILGASLSPVRAQVSDRAGLVVQYGDGTLDTYCVQLEGEDFSGYDLLEASSLQLVTAFDPTGGAAVCKIADQGCPQEDCFCEVDTYWSYWQLENDQWVYAQMGSSSRILQPGDVDGWHWSQGEPPTAVIPFSQICAPIAGQTSTPTNTPAPTSTATATLTETSPPTASPTDRVTSVSPSPTASPTQPAASPSPSSSPASAYPAPQSTATSSAAYPGPQASATPSSAYPEPQVTASPLPETSPSPESAAPATSLSPPPAEAIPLEIVTQPVSTDLPPDTALTPTPSPIQPAEPPGSSTAGIEMGLLTFGVLTILLGSGLMFVLYRKGLL